MKKIYKYKLPLVPNIKIPLPRSRKLLSAQIQGEEICVWAEIETNEPCFECTFSIVATGENPPEHMTYLSTIQLDGFVWHIFYS